MTLPTPISVLKSPRPLDESNLDVEEWRVSGTGRVENENVLARGRNALFASEVVVAFAWVVEVARVLNGHLVTVLGPVGAIASGEDLSCNTHIGY